MNGLIRASLKNPHAMIVLALTIFLIGILTLRVIPIDILPVYPKSAVQVLTFYGGMPAVGMEKSISNRMERGTGMATGIERQESRSILGVSSVRNFFHAGVNPGGAMTEVMSLAQAQYSSLPPGTLPPIVLPYDPSSTVPVCLVTLDSPNETEQVLYDVARYEVRNMLMALQGAMAPVVYGGQIRTVLMYLDRIKMQSRNLSLSDVKAALNQFNVFLPSGSFKIGEFDYAVESNSMFEKVAEMGEIPLRTDSMHPAFIKDVAQPEDTSFIQTNIVRVNGRRQVYVPVFRQSGANTLKVVDEIRKELPGIQERLTRPVNLSLVMDQSIYVRHSIAALVQEGVLGAILCSLVILLFLGEWRMTLIAMLTIPLATLLAITFLKSSGQSINVMTLAGFALAIGPLVDVAIICLENTHRHLKLGKTPFEAAYLGASEVSMPAFVSTLATFLVLTPLILVPGMGQFLFMPMMLAVTFAMLTAFVLSQTLVPTLSSLLLRHGHDSEQIVKKKTLFSRWESFLQLMIQRYLSALKKVLQFRMITVVVACLLVAVSVGVIGPLLAKEFFPSVDAGSFEIVMRAPSGTRIERTEELVEKVEDRIRFMIPKHDLKMIVTQIGVTPDLSSAYTPNAGPMDAVLMVQLDSHRSQSAQEYVRRIRNDFKQHRPFDQLEFSFESGGMLRAALNEGKSFPISISITGSNQELSHEVAERIKKQIQELPGVVDVLLVQRLNYPQVMIDVDRTKAATLGVTQEDVMKNVIAATNSSISFDKSNFWIDPVSKNQYFVGVQYPEQDMLSFETLLDIPITGQTQTTPVPLRTLATISRSTVPTEITHRNIQATIDLNMNIEGRSLAAVAADVRSVINHFGIYEPESNIWRPIDPRSQDGKTITGSRIVLSGEFTRMETTFESLVGAAGLAALMIYFLLVALYRSFLVPIALLLTVPLLLVGVLPFLYVTETAINVQSILGMIFVIGIQVANMAQLTDYAQGLRRQGLSAMDAVVKAAEVRVRPILMTGLAAFFAMVPSALALERGSEANAPIARAILGGLIAGEFATLFFLPVLYTWFARGRLGPQTAVPEAVKKAETHHSDPQIESGQFDSEDAILVT